MGRGMCVIGFAEGGLPDVAQNGHDAIFFPPGDFKIYQEKLEFYLQHPDLMQSIRKNAAATAKNYTWKKNAEETVAFCQKLRKNYGMRDVA